MQDNELTVVAQYQVGDTVTLELEPWSDVADALEGINRGELSDTRVQLAEPWWGQPGRGVTVTATVVMTRSRPVLAAVVVMVVAVTTSLTNGCSSDLSEVMTENMQGRAAELVAEAEQRGDLTVVGRDGWLFFAPELRHLSTTSYWGEAAAEVSQARNRDTVDPLPAILDFKRQLDLLNIELLVVPVPLKSVIFPDKLPGGLSLPSPIPRLDTADEAFYAVLRDNGVEVLDLTRTLLDNRLHPEGPVYCRTDTHWSGVGCVVAWPADRWGRPRPSMVCRTRDRRLPHALVHR